MSPGFAGLTKLLSSLKADAPIIVRRSTFSLLIHNEISFKKMAQMLCILLQSSFPAPNSPTGPISAAMVSSSLVRLSKRLRSYPTRPTQGVHGCPAGPTHKDHVAAQPTHPQSTRLYSKTHPQGSRSCTTDLPSENKAVNLPHG